MKTRLLPVLILMCVFLAAAGKPAKHAGYDPKRDPAADLKTAMAEAQRDGRHILLEVGGEWCAWCHYLNDLFTGDKEIADLLHQGFVVLKVNFSEENKNEAFLSQYPAIEMYPHVYVLDENGKLLHADDMTSLEAKKGYDRAKVLAFLKKWGPAAARGGGGSRVGLRQSRW